MRSSSLLFPCLAMINDDYSVLRLRLGVGLVVIVTVAAVERKKLVLQVGLHY